MRKHVFTANFGPRPGAAAALGPSMAVQVELASARVILSVTVAGWPGPPAPPKIRLAPHLLMELGRGVGEEKRSGLTFF